MAPYDRAAMVLALEAILHRQARFIPSINDKDIRKVSRVCHFDPSAVATAVEGTRGRRFYMLCDHVARMGVTTSRGESAKYLRFWRHWCSVLQQLKVHAPYLQDSAGKGGVDKFVAQQDSTW